MILYNKFYQSLNAVVIACGLVRSIFINVISILIYIIVRPFLITVFFIYSFGLTSYMS